jgi:hypothetical protein
VTVTSRGPVRIPAIILAGMDGFRFTATQLS